MVKRFAVALILLVAAAAGLGWWWARSSIPSLDAEWRLPGLREPIEVVSDPHGVPHVYARDPEDAWFAAGALHGRDRLWQMELYRRATNGRLAEALGEGTTCTFSDNSIPLRIRVGLTKLIDS
jgi:penicillin amidase